MDRKELADAVEEAVSRLKLEREAAIAKIEKIFDSAITLDNIKVHCDDNYAKVEVPIPGRTYGHEISVYYSKSWDGGKRMLSLNIGTFGSFDASMKPEVDFYVVAGQLAANLAKMQEMLDAIDFKPFDDAHFAYWRAQQALEDFDKAVRDAEEEKKLREVESKLVPGCKISFGQNAWQNDEIVKVTPKRVYFKTRGCCSTADVICNMLKHGTTWTFA